MKARDQSPEPPAPIYVRKRPHRGQSAESEGRKATGSTTRLREKPERHCRSSRLRSVQRALFNSTAMDSRFVSPTDRASSCEPLNAIKVDCVRTPKRLS